MDSEESVLEKQSKSQSSTSDSSSLSSVSSSNETASISCLKMPKTEPETDGKSVRSIVTMDDLIDDCLVPVFARVPIQDQLTSVPLTCKRWYALLKGVHLKRTNLVVRGKKIIVSDFFIKFSNRFHPKSSVSSERYVKYTVNWLSAKEFSYLAVSQADYHYQKRLDIRACIQIRDHFPNLKHLSLVYVDINPETLLALLEHFPTQLESLLLCEPCVGERSADPILMTAKECAIISQILTLIDGMPLLRQLGFSMFPAFLHNLAITLSAVLPRLEELTLSNAYLDVYPILLRLDDSKLRRLTLQYTGWHNLNMLSHLLTAKPGLRALTHLSLFGYQNLSSMDIPSVQIPLSVVEQICDHFPLLEYLNIVVNDNLRALLPHLCKLKNLVHLQIRSHSSCQLLDGCSSTELSQCGIPSLQVLSIQKPVLSRVYSSSVGLYDKFLLAEWTEQLYSLRDLFQNLRQLYLDCYLICQCLGEWDTFFLPCDRPAGCTCKSRIIKVLNSFEHLPKIKLSNSDPT